MRAWLTPPDIPSTVSGRRILIPDSAAWRAIVSGALTPLTHAYNWEKFGDVTPEDAAARARVMLLQYFQDTNMIGTIAPYITDAPPFGCLPCDGGVYLRADYPALYDILAAAFIVDADTFTTPDLRGRTVVGAGAGAGLTPRAVDESGGAETHELSIGEMPAHRHGLFQVGQLTRGTTIDPPAVWVESTFHPPFVNFTEAVGGGGAHENMPPFVALNYCVVAL